MIDDISLSRAMLDRLCAERRGAHNRVLALLEGLPVKQLNSRLSAHAPAIGFHVWHLARWEDYDRSWLDSAPQIWHERRLGTAWGFTAVELGEADTGTEMGDDASEHLAFSSKAALLEYASAAFTAMDDLTAHLPQGTLLDPVHDPQDHDRLGLLYDGLTHLNRHLGMIEALRGVLDVPGTATR